MCNRIKNLEECNDVELLKKEIKFLKWAFNKEVKINQFIIKDVKSTIKAAIACDNLPQSHTGIAQLLVRIDNKGELIRRIDNE